MRRLIVFALCCLVSPLASAEVFVPISVVGDGKADFLSAVPTEFADFGGSGLITFGGTTLDYTLTSADVGGLMITDPGPPIVANFSNSDPVTFTSLDPAENSEISMNYSGVVTLNPLESMSLTAVFVATFEPIVGSGTGIFEDVIGGSFEMTALVNEPFIPKVDPMQSDGFSMDIPYTWASTGGANDGLTVIPEPSVLAFLGLGAVGIAGRRRRRLT